MVLGPSTAEQQQRGNGQNRPNGVSKFLRGRESLPRRAQPSLRVLFYSGPSYRGILRDRSLDHVQKEGKLLDKIPIGHSPFSAPLIHPTLETGMNALSIGALSLSTAEKSEQKNQIIKESRNQGI